jgi:hypothetical protein
MVQKARFELNEISISGKITQAGRQKHIVKDKINPVSFCSMFDFKEVKERRVKLMFSDVSQVKIKNNDLKFNLAKK